jgi:hypothetical protein
MKVQIIGTGRHWVFSLTLGGLEMVSQIYTTRRACIRGLERWINRAMDETIGIWDEFEIAIRESDRQGRKP